MSPFKVLLVLSLATLGYSSGSLNFVPVGCFRDTQLKPRPLPELIHNYRLNNEMNWKDLNGSVIKPCAQEAHNRNYLYFGIQFYGECWSGPRVHETYRKNGASLQCVNGVGEGFTNMVYRLTGEENECSPSNYITFDTEDRSALDDSSGNECDNEGQFKKGWYRFQGDAGTRLNSEYVKNRCLTRNVAWYPGPYPDVTQGILTGKKACLTQDCGRFTEMKIRNCGEFFVYYLVPIPGCFFRYCGNGVTQVPTIQVNI